MSERHEDHILVLLVDDDEEDYLLTKDLLPRSGEVRHELHWAPDYQQALSACREEAYDVCLIDYRLGPDDGIQLVRELIADGHDMPMIVLTGQGDHEVDIEAARAGASDYLVKGEISPTLLERTIRYAIRSHADMRALRESEAMLRQTQRMEAVGQLAGGVAHDFNNMLTAVIGFSELGLTRLQEPDSVSHYLQEIKRAGERAIALTRQLLAFSRRQMLQTQVVDLNALVDEVQKLLARLLTDNIELRILPQPQLGSVKADPGQLEQVIMNLVINAGDALPSGGTLTIQTADVELGEDYASRHDDVQPGPYVMLAVSDDGVGMDGETMQHAFEPFFTTKEVGKGTGLGLSTVFGILKQSGGDVAIDSEPGRGTTVRVYLPRVAEPAQQVQAPTTDGELPRGSETILLVDDEELVRGFEREVLTSTGYTVLEAHGPRHALEIAREHPGIIDLLLTDVLMPGLSGPELAESLCRERPDMQTLYTSGYTPDAIAQHGVLEPDAFISKPLDRSRLAHKVREVLDSAD